MKKSFFILSILFCISCSNDNSSVDKTLDALSNIDTVDNIHVVENDLSAKESEENLVEVNQSDDGVRLLPEDEVMVYFNSDRLMEHNIDFELYRVYEYADLSGENYLFMTENVIDRDEETLFIDSIKLYKLKKGEQIATLVFQDFIIPNSDTEEVTISHWTKYFSLRDFDKDGYMDPVYVYGTLGMNNYSDGRIKILIYYLGKKVAIRHQNGVLDFERHTQVDSTFYNLPEPIQLYVQDLMKEIVENDHAIFPSGWEEAMENKMTYFDEND